MGRRKIEIKAIKDDRNRSVTFLKRKGGLFKKAHELSVLCSVDVAVIIFGHNKKLYEFSSGDINETIGRYQYYGQPHEHKGPADYRGKSDGDSEEEEEDMSPPRDEMPQQQPPQFPQSVQSQHPYPPHLRQHAPSASPPIPQHMAFQRHTTPQPANGSRPSSRTDVRRMSSNLVPPQHHHATPPPPAAPQPNGGFTYIPPTQQMYNQAHPNMPRPPPAQATPPPQYQHFQQHQQPQQQYQQPPPHLQHQQPQNHHVPQGNQPFMADQRRQSMPPASEPSDRQHIQPPPQHQPHRTPEPEQRPRPIKVDHDDTPQRPTNISSKSRSIFTPIEGSVLAQHFGFTEPRQESKHERHASDTSKLGPTSKSNQNHRTGSMPMPDRIPPSRTNTNSSKSGGARPRLKVQIPSEASDAEDATEQSSPAATNAAEATPARGSSSSRHSSGVVLPPPSPSASALLSAGATGPPNPFARPPPRDAPNLNTNHAAYTGNNNIETPISALPSRFVADNLLPSPSSFYPDWGFGRSAGGPDSNMLPSPLTFPTPIKESGVGFGGRGDRGDGGEGSGLNMGEKRKGSLETAAPVGEMKKLKT